MSAEEVGEVGFCGFLCKTVQSTELFRRVHWVTSPTDALMFLTKHYVFSCTNRSLVDGNTSSLIYLLVTMQEGSETKRVFQHIQSEIGAYEAEEAR